MTIIIKQPESTDDFKQYYSLRYRMLRAPWGEPEGSEVDDIEDRCFHLMVLANDEVIGVGRLQYNAGEEAQIRYMAVAKEFEGNGIGRMIVNTLEQEAVNNKVRTVVLDAREPAVGFYRKLGYSIKGKSYVLFDEIQHYRMTKQIQVNRRGAETQRFCV
jgi:predicted GNAT family N-acyltransferase